MLEHHKPGMIIKIKIYFASMQQLEYDLCLKAGCKQKTKLMTHKEGFIHAKEQNHGLEELYSYSDIRL
jgi:hypothetical protein